MLWLEESHKQFTMFLQLFVFHYYIYRHSYIYIIYIYIYHIYIYTYIHDKMYPTVYYHNDFPATDALGHMMYKAILVITGRAWLHNIMPFSVFVRFEYSVCHGSLMATCTLYWNWNMKYFFSQTLNSLFRNFWAS